MSFVGKVIKSSNTDELLDITLDKSLNFKSHIENICCKLSHKKRKTESLSVSHDYAAKQITK